MNTTDKQINHDIHSVIMTNLTKIIPTILLMYFITFVGQMLVMLGLLSTQSIIFSLVALVAVQFIVVFFYYGLSILLGKFYTNNHPIIGDLFAGKSDVKRLLLISVRLCVVLLIAVIVVFIPYTIYMLSNYSPEAGIPMPVETAPGENFFNYFTENPYLLAVFAFPFLILGLVILPNSLIFPVMFENPKITLGEALKQSRNLLKGKVFKFLWLCIKTTIIPVLVWALCFALTFFVTNDFFLPFIDLLSTVALYYAIICVLLASNAYYINLTTPQYEQITSDFDDGDDSCSSLMDTLPLI